MKYKPQFRGVFLPSSILISFLVTCLTLCVVIISSAETEDKNHLLDQALEVIAAKTDDLAIRSDLTSNPFLSRFGRWMETPLKAPLEAQHEAMEFFRLAKDPGLWFKKMARAGDISTPVALPVEKHMGFELPAHLPEKLREAIRLILDSINTANIKLAAIRKGITPQQRKLLEKYLYPISPTYSDFVEEIKGPPRVKEIREALNAAGGVDRKGIFEAGLTVIQALVKAKDLLMEKDKWDGNIRSFSFTTDLGVVEIGGPDSDLHESQAALVIDLGGNDSYRGRTASGMNGKCSIVLDLDGDDIYLGEDYTQGSGFWGIGVLWDLKGNDLYRAGNYSQGSGLFGIGLLMDGGGRDTYLGGVFVQAASSWGWGGLIDLEGEDSYECQHSGQAYSGVFGISYLCDLGGNDKYISGSSAPDPREPDMNQSFSQGFAIGLRNLAGGGFALLADRCGNDLYQCQYFGQGASYWMGMGILYDENGKDTYVARRYAQGAGIHNSFGLLMDAGGDDNIISWGVSQGCGHDYGIGILINESGNDSYVSDWLSMGASNANGIGIFVDNAGKDRYGSKTGMPVGQLSKGRRAGGIGIFIDAGGKDIYSRDGADNSVWGSNRFCIGLDVNEGRKSGLNILQPKDVCVLNPEAERQKERERFRLSWILEGTEEMPYPDNIESILSVASHRGFETGIPEEAKDKLLNMKPEKSVPAMVNLLDTPNVGGLIFLKKFFSIQAFHAIPAFIKKSGSPNPDVKSRVYYYIGFLKDTRALGSCLEALQDPSWKVRSSAIRAIGEMLNKERLDFLIPMKEAFEEAFKKEDPDIIEEYLGVDNKRTTMVLSVLARAVPLDFHTYKEFSGIRTGKEKKKALQDFVLFVFDHLREIIPLMETWTRDINGSEEVAGRLKPYLSDPDPAVKRAAAYSLGQMRYDAAIAELLELLNDPQLWVRDAAVLSLALFQNEVIYPLRSKMKKEDSPYKILALDTLARIKTDRAKALIEGYLDDPDQNVRRAAAKALVEIEKGT